MAAKYDGIPGEKEVVTILAEKLRRKLAFDGGAVYKNVFSFMNPGANRALRDRFAEIFGVYVPPLQPEIDIILHEHDDALRATEVKYFKMTGKRLDRSYYEGIEQGLALLNLGFDSAAVWQVFTDEANLDDVSRYASRTWKFIQNDLRLPLDYTVFVLSDYLSAPTMTVMQADWDKPGNPLYSLTDIEQPNFLITYRGWNPLLKKPEVQRTRLLLQEWLGIS